MHPENIPEGMDRSRGKENCDEIRYAFFLFQEIAENGRTSFTVVTWIKNKAMNCFMASHQFGIML